MKLFIVILSSLPQVLEVKGMTVGVIFGGGDWMILDDIGCSAWSLLVTISGTYGCCSRLKNIPCEMKNVSQVGHPRGTASACDIAPGIRALRIPSQFHRIAILCHIHRKELSSRSCFHVFPSVFPSFPEFFLAEAIADSDGWSVDTSGCTAVLSLWKEKRVRTPRDRIGRLQMAVVVHQVFSFSSFLSGLCVACWGFEMCHWKPAAASVDGVEFHRFWERGKMWQVQLETNVELAHTVTVYHS